jgi:pimeloyl-ACP methyl ester carboxylesterase
MRWRFRLMPERKGPRVFPFATKHVETPSGRIACFDEGRGPALVFVHGLGGDFTHFEHIAPAFTDRFRVIGVDMPGCGDSHKPRGRVSVRGYATALLDLLTTLRISTATLVGHSAGGLVCAQAALMAPDRVDQLVLINSAGVRHYSWPVRLAARMLLRRPIVDAILVLSRDAILKHVFSMHSELTVKFAEDNIHRPREATLADISKVMQDLLPDLMVATLAENAEKLGVPTLMIYGDEDRLVPLHQVRRAAARLQWGRLEVLAQCGHMPIIEQPQVVVRLLRSFLEPRQVRLEAVP